jgi:hypothetical protein
LFFGIKEEDEWEEMRFWLSLVEALMESDGIRQGVMARIRENREPRQATG